MDMLSRVYHTMVILKLTKFKSFVPYAKHILCAVISSQCLHLVLVRIVVDEQVHQNVEV